jgi:hypothetical protein
MTIPVPPTQVEPDGIAGYTKAIVALLTPLIILVADAWADGSITAAEWKTIALGALPVAVAVYFFANKIRVRPPLPPVQPVDPPPAGQV